MPNTPRIEQVDGEWWVDSGLADVGPFESEDEASAHIERMARDRMLHDIQEIPRPISAKSVNDSFKFIGDIARKYF